MKKGTKFLIACMVIGCAAGAGAVAASQYMSDLRETRVYLGETVINGVPVQGKTPEEAAALLLTDPETTSISLHEKEETVLSGSLPEYGVRVDAEAFNTELEEVFSQQTTNIIHALKAMYSVDDLTVDVPYEVDEEVFNAKVNGGALSVARTKGTDAEIRFDPEKKLLYVEPEVDGNELDDAKLQKYVRSEIETALKDPAFMQADKDGVSLDLTIPEDVYLETNKRISADSLQEECDRYNQYAHAVITYTFGSQTQELDFNTFKDWLVFDGDTASLKDEAVDAYIQELSDKYNTRWLDRTFRTTYGSDITIRAGRNEYGYRINKEAEKAQLTEDILGNTPVTREPCYDKTNSWGNPYYLAREGTDDLNGTYVEVNLSAQHLWFYKNGSLIVESDVVSGDMSEDGRSTASGAFPLAYKDRDVTLRGGQGDEEYESPVQYWMPFYEGQGLHDAPWRSSFGGDIYKYAGSHGCVNLPPSVARTIYENISVGTAIILYY